MNAYHYGAKACGLAGAFLVVAIAVGPGKASASQIVTETWAYANGSAVQGLNGGTGWAGAWQQVNGRGTMRVANGALVDSGGNPISAVSSRALATNQSSGTIWIGFTSNFVNASGGSDQLRFSESGATTGGFGGNGPNTNGNTGPNHDYNLFGANLSPGVDLGVAVGTGPHFALMEINYGAGTSTVWMDPNLNNLGAGLTANFAPAFDKIVLVGKPNGSFGSLVIGTTEASVVPEPASLALLGVGLLGVCAVSRGRGVFSRT